MAHPKGTGLPGRGRGAVSNRAGRFERLAGEPVDDGWETLAEESVLRTEVLPDTSRSVIATNQSPDVPFDQSVNPYRGCEHGCAYCFARPSHAYLGLSPGLDFESQLFAKFDAGRLLARELARKTYRCAPLALGVNTDAYQPVERRLRITRGVLETASRFAQPVMIVTKSNLILRDLDLLAALAARNLVGVMVSVTTLDDSLARALEPRAPAPRRRIEAIGRLAAAGVPTGVMVAPIIPGLSDHEIEGILEAAAEAGAAAAGYILLRLPGEVAGLFAEWLETHRPDRARRVLSLVRQCRGGRANDPRFGTRMTGTGPFAALIKRRFDTARERLGLARHLPDLDTRAFRVPEEADGQFRLL